MKFDPYYGKEPKFSEVTDENVRQLLGEALNWYAANESNSTIAKWARNEYTEFESLSEDNLRKLGLLIRVRERGLSHPLIEEYIINELEKLRKIKPSKRKLDNKQIRAINSPQEKHKESVAKFEIALDEISLKNKTNFSLDEIPKEHIKFIKLRANSIKNDMEVNKEAYKKNTTMSNFLSQILEYEVEIVKKKRNRPKNNTKLVSKLKLDPNGHKLENIIGSRYIIIYDESNRNIFVYYKATEEGLTVKGNVIKNFDEKKSFRKKLRVTFADVKTFFSGTNKQILTKIEEERSMKYDGLSGRVTETMKLMVLAE